MDINFTAHIERLDNDDKGYTFRINAANRLEAEQGLRIVAGFFNAREEEFSLEVPPLHSAFVTETENGVELTERVVQVTYVRSDEHV
jgi:hypothetical protein